MPYAELHCLTNFSFLRGASHADELVAQAVALGYRALAITVVAAITAASGLDVAIRMSETHPRGGAVPPSP
jgi:error-prone DNA polymerase